ncbi:MAG: hypothetical protein KF745_06960 [Phycisphaeraceae bacterium]|nr:hypothetical protein [Phycisphaeraceae bacterium]
MKLPAGRRCLLLALIALPLTGMILLVAGCNTMKGMGRDITSASTDIESSVFGSSETGAPPPRHK